MVLTRAQRAQAKDMPPASPPKSSLLKAPVRRGRPKKTQDDPATDAAPKVAVQKTAPKEVAPKAAPLKSSVSKASTTSARIATTKASAATIRTTAAPKEKGEKDETKSPKHSIAKKAKTKTGAPKTEDETMEKKAPKGTSVKKATKSTGPKTLAIKTASLKASTTRKPAVPKKAMKTLKAEKPADPAEDEEDELAMDEKQVEVQDFATTQEKKEISITLHRDAVREEPPEDTMAASSLKTPSKIPLSALAIAQPAPMKLPSLSPNKIPGSVRKPVVSSVLFASPVKLKAVIEHEPTDLGSPKRPNAVEETVGLAKSPVRPNVTSEQPVGQDSTTAEAAAGISRTPVRPAPTPGRPYISQSVAKPETHAMISQTPVRPNIAMKRSVLSQSASIPEKQAGISQTPIRPNASMGQNIFKQSLAQSVRAPDFTQSTNKRTAVPFSDSVLVPAKRLRTSFSMPVFDLGVPKLASSNRPGSPPSPVKSSMRSPEKQRSPKKVSWHQSPLPQRVMQDEPPEKITGPLDGLVFFLDVNNVEGVDSNELFAPVIEQLGGYVVPDWTSNSMGVTHVVFMNGEMRTLEKIVATNGQVHCVNISWVLDCEREHTHLNEKEFKYAIDLTRIPGLITPKTSQTYNSLATPIPSRTPAAPPPSQRHFDFAPTTPAREPLGLMIRTPGYFKPKTPASVGMGSVDPVDWDDKENVSPEATSPLLQKTCPPKQQNKSLFGFDEAVTPFKNRFLLARRRSVDGA
ncbi:brct domain-containing protein [Venturia nashicola]|uniref:Brct domain-containing protein n=1 Tax=Venturia nashicola TaxID=86259 RepID=A0A4Z1P503_9PEZI|nr:brct domain-containing protein [Venturia nashicola]TLD35873.1 brct domain-containing protein [Venturia nashicola]